MECMDLDLYLLRSIMERMGLQLYDTSCSNHTLPSVDWRRNSSSILHQPAGFNQERAPIVDWCSSFGLLLLHLVDAVILVVHCTGCGFSYHFCVNWFV